MSHKKRRIIDKHAKTNPKASADAQEHRNAIAIDDEGLDDFFQIDQAGYQRGRQYWKKGLTDLAA